MKAGIIEDIIENRLSHGMVNKMANREAEKKKQNGKFHLYINTNFVGTCH